MVLCEGEVSALRIAGWPWVIYQLLRGRKIVVPRWPITVNIIRGP